MTLHYLVRLALQAFIDLEKHMRVDALRGLGEYTSTDLSIFAKSDAEELIRILTYSNIAWVHKPDYWHYWNPLGGNAETATDLFASDPIRHTKGMCRFFFERLFGTQPLRPRMEAFMLAHRDILHACLDKGPVDSELCRSGVQLYALCYQKKLAGSASILRVVPDIVLALDGASVMGIELLTRAAISKTRTRTGARHMLTTLRQRAVAARADALVRCGDASKRFDSAAESADTFGLQLRAMAAMLLFSDDDVVPCIPTFASPELATCWYAVLPHTAGAYTFEVAE
jgi:hypothetical protein